MASALVLIVVEPALPFDCPVMPCRVALLALWASIAAANPLHVEPRQDTTPSSSEAGSAASLAAEVLGDEISLDLSQKEAADDTGLFPGMSCNQLAGASTLPPYHSMM